MEDNLLEGIRLQNATLTLNPNDLETFDSLVGKKNRSRKVRELIRDYNKNAVVQTSE